MRRRVVALGIVTDLGGMPKTTEYRPDDLVT